HADPQPARGRSRDHRHRRQRRRHRPRPGQPGQGQRHRSAQRERAPPRHLRRQLPAAARQRARPGHVRADRHPAHGRRGPGDRVKTIVVDDEQLARDELRFLLEQLEDVDVVAQAGNGVEALRVIEEYQPDLVMLDVQMPGLTGFEVARRVVQAGIESQLVFVTAYDQYAIDAFEVNAVDYLLKPVEAEPLGTGVDP